MTWVLSGLLVICVWRWVVLTYLLERESKYCCMWMEMFFEAERSLDPGNRRRIKKLLTLRWHKLPGVPNLPEGFIKEE